MRKSEKRVGSGNRAASSKAGGRSNEEKRTGDKRGPARGDKRPRKNLDDKEARPARRKEFKPGKNTAGDSAPGDRRRPIDKDTEHRRPAFKRNNTRERKPEGREGDKPFRKFRESANPRSEDKPRRSFGGRDENRRPEKNLTRDSAPDDRRRSNDGETEHRRPAFKRDNTRERKPEGREGDKSFRKFRESANPRSEDKPRRSFASRNEDKRPGKDKKGEAPARRVKYEDLEDGKSFSRPSASSAPSTRKPSKPKRTYKKQTTALNPQTGDGLTRLNKYLSNAGIASRREADTLIQSGAVKVNGVVVDQLGHKIQPGDKVTYGDAPVKSEHKVYLLLNKPKDYITTVDDPQERKTVMELVAKACRERIYPVGRLDRNTTGLLLFTNDGELTTKLMHPKYSIKKVYHVSLNKGLKPEDFKAIREGIELEDGLINADDLAFVGEGKKEIGIEIHSGRNRIVRRIFEHLGYDVLKLDRVAFAGLTKKDLPRGKYRFLTAKEIGFLQMIG